MVFGNIFVVIGLIGSSYSFSRGVPVFGLVFIFLIIIGLLMNPPTCIPETVESMGGNDRE